MENERPTVDDHLPLLPERDAISQKTPITPRPQTRFKKSPKAIIFVTLYIFWYVWKAGKIVFCMRPLSLPLRRNARKAVSHEAGQNHGNGKLQDSKTQTRYESAKWKMLWRRMIPRYAVKHDWKLAKRLKLLYGKMSEQLMVYSRFRNSLNEGVVWKRIAKRVLGKNSLVLLEYGWKRDGVGSERSGKAFRLLQSCLQGLKILRYPRRSLTWGEIVQSEDQCCQSVIKSYNTRLQLYRKMPLRRMSRLWGQFNQLELPIWLRSWAIRLYIWMFDCHLEEAAIQDLKQYPNVGQFFQRHLRPGVRPIDRQHPLTSPCDGTVLHCGVVKNSTLEQVKGVTYSLKGFLGPLDGLTASVGSDGDHTGSLQQPNQSEMENVDYSQRLLTNSANCLYHCVIYLAPGDYHRFHSPADWTVRFRRHFPGELFSVNPSIARWLQGLFSFNERVVYCGQWRHGFMSMTPVGATNVGSISINHDQELLTNVERTWPSGCFHDKDFTDDGTKGGVTMTKGEPFGHFSLGSTIVLLFEAPRNFKFGVEPGMKLKYGEGIGSTCVEKSKKKKRRRPGHRPKLSRVL